MMLGRGCRGAAAGCFGGGRGDSEGRCGRGGTRGRGGGLDRGLDRGWIFNWGRDFSRGFFGTNRFVVVHLEDVLLEVSDPVLLY